MDISHEVDPVIYPEPNKILQERSNCTNRRRRRTNLYSYKVLYRRRQSDKQNQTIRNNTKIKWNKIPYNNIRKKNNNNKTDR